MLDGCALVLGAGAVLARACGVAGVAWVEVGVAEVGVSCAGLALLVFMSAGPADHITYDTLSLTLLAC